MNVANICSPQWTGLFPQGLYRMALAHWVKDYPAYQRNLRARVPSIRGPEAPYILMDNGIFEDQQLSPHEIQEASELLGASEVILPDVQGEPTETLNRSWKALKHIYSTRVMFVPQGRTKDAWRECLSLWVSRWESSALASKRTLSIGVTSLRESVESQGTSLKAARQSGSRPDLIEIANAYGYSMHLLGVGSIPEFLASDLPIALRLRVRGVDTSTAFAQGAAGKLLTPTNQKILLGDPSEYEILSTQGRRLVHLNTLILNDWVSSGVVLPGIPTRIIRNAASKWLKFYGEGFATVEDVMIACHFPVGKYALHYSSGEVEEYVRRLKPLETLKSNERLIERRD